MKTKLNNADMLEIMQGSRLCQYFGKKMQEHGFTIPCSELCSWALTASLGLLQGLILIPLASVNARLEGYVELLD